MDPAGEKGKVLDLNVEGSVRELGYVKLKWKSEFLCFSSHWGQGAPSGFFKYAQREIKLSQTETSSSAVDPRFKPGPCT